MYLDYVCVDEVRVCSFGIIYDHDVYVPCVEYYVFCFEKLFYMYVLQVLWKYFGYCT